MDERSEVSAACAVLERSGLSDLIWGHVSCRDREGRGIWIKSSGFGLEETTPERVILVAPDGTRLEGDGGVPIELPIHAEILAARPDVGCVVHCHPTYGIALGATGEVLRPMSHEGALFVPPDVVRFEDTADLVRTPEAGQLLASRLGSRNAALMVNHGIVTVGESTASAVMAAVLLERACELQLLAMSAGGVRRYSDDEEALEKRARCWPPNQIESGYAYLMRRLAVTSTDPAAER